LAIERISSGRKCHFCARWVGSTFRRNGFPVKTAIVDASSAILLFKAGLFDRLIRTYAATFPEAVWTELTADGYPGAAAFRRAVRLRRVAVPPAPGHPLPSEAAALHAGEREAVALFLSGAGDFLVLDDRRGALACRALSIPFVNALLFPRILWLSGRMAESGFRRATARVAAAGRYGEDVRAKARTLGKNDLAVFLP
jgi:hypothetical protein